MNAISPALNIDSLVSALILILSLSAYPTTTANAHPLGQSGAEGRGNLSQDTNRTIARKVFAEGERLRKQETAESLRKAIEKYDEALRHFRVLADYRGEASTLDSIGITYNLLEEKQKALECYNQAL